MSGELTAPRNSDMLKPADVVGHLLIVRPQEFVAGIATVHGPVDAIRCDVADLNQNNPDGSYGVTFRDVLWFGRQLIPGLRRQIGDLVLGWMSQGINKPGQDPPYLLTDAMGDAAARTAAQGWLNAHPEFDAATVAPVTTPTNAVVPSPPTMPAVTPQAAPVAPSTLPVPGGGSNSVLAALDPAQREALKALGFDLNGK